MFGRAAFYLLVAAAFLAEIPGGRVGGQYFLYASLDYKQTGITTTGITVLFTLKTAWKRSFFDKSEGHEPYGPCNPCSSDGITNAEKQECSDICLTPPCSCLLTLPGDEVYIFDPRDFDTATGTRPPVPVSTTFSFGENPDDSLKGRRSDQGNAYRPFCLDTVPPSCIKGRVVDSRPNATAASPLWEENAAAVVYVVSEFHYTYPKSTATYVAGFQGCCRLPGGDKGLRNNQNGAWDVKVKVAVTDSQAIFQTGTADAPFLSHIPITAVIKGRPLSFKLHATDAAGRPITFTVGDNNDHGVGLSQSNAPEPHGNNMAASVDPATGIVTFPASASTSYELFYNLVIKASVKGPCFNWDAMAGSTICLKQNGQPQTTEIVTVVDFLLHVVQAGYQGIWPDNDCSAGNAGLPIGSGSKVCNNMPIVTVPTSPQKFICGELNQFEVSATDGVGKDRSFSNAFAIRHRLRMILSPNYPTTPSMRPSFPTEDSACCVRAIAGVNDSTARGIYKWTPQCERLEDDFLYSYAGRHRLDVKGVCFSATDDGGWTAWTGKLTAPAACVSIPVLRCTKPTIRLDSTSKAATNITMGRYTVPVATNISFFLNATDDLQTRSLSIFHTADPGIPAVGARWITPKCFANSTQQIACSPTDRQFQFASMLVHAGSSPRVCFEAVNDQVECPRYRKNPGAQPYGIHKAGGIAVSQASEPLCVTLDVPGPDIRWKEPTPTEGQVILTYMGCPLELTLVAEDDGNYFDLQVQPWTEEYAMPKGVVLSPDLCRFVSGLPAPSIVSDGVGTCPSVSRKLSWTPERDQTGLKQKVCVNAVSRAARVAVRCFTLHVSKCRYCAQPGETMQSLAESFQTDWLQLWGANAHVRNPHDFKLHQLINIGALYPARASDTLASLAYRFRTTAATLLVANPEVGSATAALEEGQSICVLPGICNSAEYKAAPGS